jgi:16S rRNA (cytidine1402-2'-O)-methyltransferase
MKPSHSQPRSKREPGAGAGQGSLVLIATPIGNLGDITARALEGLKSADLIACEDSRVTVRLLQHAGIEKPLLPYHDHNAETMRPKLLARIAAGERVALVSDAGTPLISDPGYKLVKAAVARELTKLFEEVPRDPLSALVAHYEQAGAPKGEIVIVVGPPEEERASVEDIDTLLRQALERMSVKDAAATVAAATGAPKRTVYARALELQGENR